MSFESEVDDDDFEALLAEPEDGGLDDSELVGVVKSVNLTRGFGFIGSKDVGRDVYVDRGVLRTMGLDAEELNALTGKEVAFKLHTSKDGQPQASQVRLLLSNGDEDEEDEELKAAGELPGTCLEEEDGEDSGEGKELPERLEGTVKWFQSDKGFGFITCDEVDKDVYVNMKEMPAIRGRDLRGKPVAFTLYRTKDGQPQANGVTFLSDDADAAGDASDLEMGGADGNGGSDSDSKRHDGTILSFNSTKGFGFIKCEATDKDVFFKKMALPEEICKEFSEFGYSLIDIVGRPASFNLIFTHDGKPQAQSIVVLGEPMVGEVQRYVNNQYGFVVSAAVRQSLNMANLYFRAPDLPAELRTQVTKGMIVRFEIQMQPGEIPKPKAVNFVFHREQLPAGLAAPIPPLPPGTPTAGMPGAWQYPPPPSHYPVLPPDQYPPPDYYQHPPQYWPPASDIYQSHRPRARPTVAPHLRSRSRSR